MKTKRIPDSRYTIRPEFCGYATARYVIRFCDEWITSACTLHGAIAAARNHRAAWMRRAFRS